MGPVKVIPASSDPELLHCDTGPSSVAVYRCPKCLEAVVNHFGQDHVRRWFEQGRNQTRRY